MMINLMWNGYVMPVGGLLQVRDLWRRKALGVFSEGFTYKGLPSHATALIVVAACSGPGATCGGHA